MHKTEMLVWLSAARQRASSNQFHNIVISGFSPRMFVLSEKNNNIGVTICWDLNEGTLLSHYKRRMTCPADYLVQRKSEHHENGCFPSENVLKISTHQSDVHTIFHLIKIRDSHIGNEHSYIKYVDPQSGAVLDLPVMDIDFNGRGKWTSPLPVAPVVSGSITLW